jgi:hypothetical protein
LPLRRVTRLGFAALTREGSAQFSIKIHFAEDKERSLGQRRKMTAGKPSLPGSSPGTT